MNIGTKTLPVSIPFFKHGFDINKEKVLIWTCI